MSINDIEDIEDIAAVLQGYEQWKRTKLHAIENGPDDYQLSPSAYIDEYAKMRALEILEQIQAVCANKELGYGDIVDEIRNLIGAE